MAFLVQAAIEYLKTQDPDMTIKELLHPKKTNSISNIGHKIKNREVPQDVFITPVGLAKHCISLHNSVYWFRWLDPCCNNGSFYNNFPTTNNKTGYDILGGCGHAPQNFFNESRNSYDIISTNPPYSLLDAKKGSFHCGWLEQCRRVATEEIGLLLAAHAITPKRIQEMNDKGWFLKTMFMTKVFNWYGMSCYVIFSTQITENIIQFDRKVWR